MRSTSGERSHGLINGQPRPTSKILYTSIGYAGEIAESKTLVAVAAALTARMAGDRKEDRRWRWIARLRFPLRLTSQRSSDRTSSTAIGAASTGLRPVVNDTGGRAGEFLQRLSIPRLIRNVTDPYELPRLGALGVRRVPLETYRLTVMRSCSASPAPRYAVTSISTLKSAAPSGEQVTVRAGSMPRNRSPT